MVWRRGLGLRAATLSSREAGKEKTEDCQVLGYTVRVHRPILGSLCPELQSDGGEWSRLLK